MKEKSAKQGQVVAFRPRAKPKPRPEKTRLIIFCEPGCEEGISVDLAQFPDAEEGTDDIFIYTSYEARIPGLIKQGRDKLKAAKLAARMQKEGSEDATHGAR